MDEVVLLIQRLSNGNPGALTFCMEAVKYVTDDSTNEKVVCVFERACVFDIIGDKLYMIWNDCCNRDTEKTLTVMLESSKDDLLKHLNYENGRGIPFK